MESLDAVLKLWCASQRQSTLYKYLKKYGRFFRMNFHQKSRTCEIWQLKASFSMGFRSYVRYFRGAILGLLRPSEAWRFAPGRWFFPWCFPIRGQRWARNNCDWCCGPAWHEWKLDTVMMVNKTANSLCHYWNSKCPLELKPHPPIQELELCTNTVHRECYETHLNLWSYLSNTLWVHLGQENEADYIQVVAHRVYTPGSAAGAAALKYENHYEIQLL